MWPKTRVDVFILSLHHSGSISRAAAAPHPFLEKILLLPSFGVSFLVQLSPKLLLRFKDTELRFQSEMAVISFWLPCFQFCPTNQPLHGKLLLAYNFRPNMKLVIIPSPDVKLDSFAPFSHLPRGGRRLFLFLTQSSFSK